jgi:uncharacterized membrane protein YjgN (DUF898 family)
MQDTGQTFRRDPEDSGAFAFSGGWREFAPIAFTNLLLSIVTLGVYIFWARARERRYLWSHTRFIDDRLEWTGTGRELMIGYGLAVLLFALPIGLVNFIAFNAAIMRGHEGVAGLLGFAMYLLFFFLTGLAVFRGLRYRLSRTMWHGIRGGSDSFGLAFGWSYLWKILLGSFSLGLLTPWAMTSLWNDRFGEMSFGPFRFQAEARAGPIFLRFMLFYLAPVLFFVAAAGVVVLGMFTGIFTGVFNRVPAGPSPTLPIVLFAIIAAAYLLFFVVLGVIALVFYAAYFRQVVGTLRLGELHFAFTATTSDWIRLFIGNFTLVFCTLGIGYVFIGYRNWTFFVRYMQAYGEIELTGFTQSTTRAPRQGEGLLDAFDIGAI